MYNNEDYNQEIEALRSRAATLEQTWLAESPDARRPLIEQYPSPIRPHQKYWAASPPADTVVPQYPPCPRCASGNFMEERVLEGVRHNGDGYGARYDICRGCGWTVWWLYDEA